MGHHINEKGEFQSDKYPDLKPDKIVLSFHDQNAVAALHLFVRLTHDKGLAADIYERLRTLEGESSQGFLAPFRPSSTTAI